MTSKLKCPVCNHELYQTASEPATYCCLYKDCQGDFKFAGSKELWQALTQAKQDLEIATKELEEIRGEYETHRGAERECFTINWDVVAKRMYDCGKYALEQIEHKVKDNE